MTADTYEGVETGGPLYGGIDSAKINVGVWIRFPEFHSDKTILIFNIDDVLPMKQGEGSILTL